MAAAWFHSTMESPIGELTLLADETGLTGVHMEYRRHPPAEQAWRSDELRFRVAKDQLAAYFTGELREFDLPLAPVGTPFQRKVWDALMQIPYGETISYGELARRLGDVKASRAVGLANGKNPIAIIVPCHRVIGASGDLTGYGGGLERKRWLLDHEAGPFRLL
ncbi:MAG: ogt 4 [Hydrocarboniphaga sp.]|uniref:methylated-DNA--[protein]-cysteine S-methyltransferase n=1 Tax=Hydrocarboniphaga sp. TaxID=2033016 RepID=UPI00262A9632|nr:methylated-DNA--[protein]-cysteine S-methyltransferase [Hydrocarboniphaga sp.]MDB5968884.1 ogt 4 [Hydrocarboniphaga sp.]